MNFKAGRDSAEASFELMARQALGEVPDYFSIGRFRVTDERRFNAKGELVVESEATAAVVVGGTTHLEAAGGMVLLMPLIQRCAKR